jgi:amino acid transporter
MVQNRPPRGPSILVMVISFILAVVGGFSLLAVLNTDDATLRLFYSLISLFSFTLVFLSLFRIRRRYSISTVVPYKVLSIVRCAQCSFKQLRNFTPGDYVDKTEGKCAQCGTGSLFINGIYSEGPPRR